MNVGIPWEFVGPIDDSKVDSDADDGAVEGKSVGDSVEMDANSGLV